MPLRGDETPPGSWPGYSSLLVIITGWLGRRSCGQDHSQGGGDSRRVMAFPANEAPQGSEEAVLHSGDALVPVWE